MKQIDLITGFLGAGKTTFIRRYADFLMRCGSKIGILENDYGAVNVDMMLLQDLEGENCGVEAVAGGCCADCHRRRFKTKLIALGMSDYDRVLIEPSGIFDVDEFFDSLCEPPLDSWYEIGSVIAVVDAVLGELSRESEYLLLSQAANAGRIVLSKSQNATEEQINNTIARLNAAAERFGCKRRFGADVIAKPWDELTDADFEDIKNSGYQGGSFTKRLDTDGYQSVYFLEHGLTENALREKVNAIFEDKSCGSVFRIKGFFSDNGWKELNASKSGISVTPVEKGQEVIIVIGEQLDENRIKQLVVGS